MIDRRIGVALGLTLATIAPARAQQPPAATRPRPAAAPGAAPAPAVANPARAAQAKAGGNAAPAGPVVPLSPETEALLVAWEARGRETKTLHAKFSRYDDLVTSGEHTIFEGEAELEAPDHAYVNFREREENGKFEETLTERIVVTGRSVVQYVKETKQMLVFPLPDDPAQRNMDLGPLQFLFGMKKADITRRYNVEVLPSKAAVADQHLIQITPKFKEDAAGFLVAQVLLNKSTYQPNAIKIWLPSSRPNVQDTQRYMFKEIVANAPVDAKRFQATKLPGWQVVENPGAPTNRASAPRPNVGGPLPRRVGAAAPKAAR